MKDFLVICLIFKPNMKKKRSSRDIEKVYSKAQFIKKLRRFADALETGKKFSIQIAGEHVSIPRDAIIHVAHEREKGLEEVEFQMQWKV